MNFEPSADSLNFTERVRDFIRDAIAPIEAAHWEAMGRYGADWTLWRIPKNVEELKVRARREGLWNLFLPDATLGAGLSTLEYAPVAEATGHSVLAPEIFNCNAPDSGNMEVIWRYGNTEQKNAWLTPLLDGSIRSVFAMTEPDVASSDATNMQATARIDGDFIVLNGRKHWSSGLGDPRARIAIVMAHTPDASLDKHHQHSMVLVPLDTPGVAIVRMQSVFGSFDPPHGHGELLFTDVRVPVANFIRGPGAGFEIAQGRLGPGRIHHCMRCIGAAEEALALAVKRASSRNAFGKRLIDLGGNRERIAEARVAINQARLLTLHAAWMLDRVGAMAAMTEIAAIKVVAPRLLQDVVDMAMQLHGGVGLSGDTLLAQFFAQARALRLADGPDEVHLGLIARLELARHG